MVGVQPNCKILCKSLASVSFHLLPNFFLANNFIFLTNFVDILKDHDMLTQSLNKHTFDKLKRVA